MPKPDAGTIEVPEEIAEYISELEQTNSELNSALESYLAKSTTDGDEDNEDDINEDDPVEVIKALLSKSDDDGDRALLSKALESVEQAKADAANAMSIAKAEQDNRLTREFIAKAAELDQIAANPVEFGPVLKAASEALTTEQFDVLTTVLKAANEQVKEGSLYQELGKGSDPNELNTDDPLMAAAAKLMSSEGLDRFSAIAKAVDQDPTLYQKER